MAVIADTITYPENQDEAGLNRMVQKILANLDRDRLLQSQDEQLKILHHPLIQKRIGMAVALNTEIFLLISHILDALMVSKGVLNHEDHIALAKKAETMLLEVATDREELQLALSNLKTTVSQLIELNVGKNDQIRILVKDQMRRNLPPRSTVQDIVVYRAVNSHIAGESQAKILQELERTRRHYTAELEDKTDDETKQFLTELNAETMAAEAWFKNDVPKQQLIIESDIDTETVLTHFGGVKLQEVDILKGSSASLQALDAWMQDTTGITPPPLVYIGTKKER